MNAFILVPDQLFSKTTLFNAFQEGFKSKAALQYFGDTFLKLLSEALFKSEHYIRDIKPNEFSSMNLKKNFVLKFVST